MAKTFIRSVPLGKDSGKTFNVPLHDLLPEAVIDIALAANDGTKEALLRDLLLVGTSRIFVDCQASAKTDAERLGACQKKLDAWREGTMNVRGGIGGGETVEGEVKRLLLAAYMERTGATLAKAEGALKGRGFEVLRAIADAKAEATVPATEDEPARIEGESDEAFAAREAAYAESVTHRAALVKEASDGFYTAAEADWRKRADASLAAKAKAREATTSKLDLTTLLD